MKTIIASLAVVCAGCVNTTGGSTVTFGVAAAGPADVTGGVRTIDTGRGWHVVLTTAKLHIGAIYLNLTVPSSGSQFTNCILPGIYTAEELHGLDVDLLSAAPQAFPASGVGTDDNAKTGEVWLTGGDVNAASDPTLIADLAGTATNATQTIPFTASITIGGNRLIPPSDPAQPSAHPICKQRIVSPIRLDLRPRDGGTLLVRVDPALWFADVDFAGLTQVSTTPPAFVFPDDNSTPASQNLFTGLRAASGTYSFSFE
ncbi:MAG: hypothetical protein JWO36_6654 [Myxococcales bacterium]|nr:hypothetical protein [Myxococcales bacterium]